MKRMASACAVVLVAWLGGCGSDSKGGGSGGADDCVTACNKAQALHCPNDTAGDCAAGCQVERSLPVCQAELAALMTCSANAPVMCGSDGKAAVQGCSNEGLAYFRCFAGGLDGGFPD